MEGYQAWEVLLKLPEPDLKTAFEIAQNLGFDMAIMTELLPTAIQGMKEGIQLLNTFRENDVNNNQGHSH